MVRINNTMALIGLVSLSLTTTLAFASGTRLAKADPTDVEVYLIQDQTVVDGIIGDGHVYDAFDGSLIGTLESDGITIEDDDGNVVAMVTDSGDTIP